MRLMKYKDVLVLAKEKINEALAPLRANESKKNGELEICKLESVIAEKEQAIQKIASEYPLNYEKLLDALDELDLMKRKKDQFEKVIADLFD